jgi:dTMP kinase
LGLGVLLALEGVDGSGKTTQARLLAAALKEQGRAVVLTQEPTGGPLGQRLRYYLQGPARNWSPEEELELFLADRREHVRLVIEPALAAGQIIICDRYYYSSVAYQGALGLDPTHILAVNEAFAPRPDLLFILILPPALALARLAGARPGGRQMTEDTAYLERVATIYASLEGPQIRRLDAAARPAAVHQVLLQETLAWLQGPGRRTDPSPPPSGASFWG